MVSEKAWCLVAGVVLALGMSHGYSTGSEDWARDVVGRSVATVDWLSGKAMRLAGLRDAALVRTESRVARTEQARARIETHLACIQSSLARRQAEQVRRQVEKARQVANELHGATATSLEPEILMEAPDAPATSSEDTI
jgi:hypothetical protein